MYRQSGIKISQFLEENTLTDDTLFTIVQEGTNFKITLDELLPQLGATGTLEQAGDVTAVPVLDQQGTVNYIRNLENGTGISCEVSPDNGIIITATGLRVGGIVSMQGNASATTIAGTGTPALVAGTWTVGDSEDMTGTTAGRLTYDATADAPLNMTACITVEPSSGNDKMVSVYLAKNGTVIAGSRIEAEIDSGIPQALTTTWMDTLETDDYIEVFVQNATDTTTLVVSRAILRVG